MQFGFLLLLAETALMTIINGGLLMKSLSISVGKMSEMFEEMASGQGDLTKRLNVTGLSEVGRLAFWFNEFMNDIEQIVGHVRETSLQLHQSIEEVSGGSQDLSQATQEQAAAVEEISASIEEMNGTVLHNADLIREGGHVERDHQAHRAQQAGVRGPDEGDPGDIPGFEEDRGHRADGERGGLPHEPSGAERLGGGGPGGRAREGVCGGGGGGALAGAAVGPGGRGDQDADPGDGGPDQERGRDDGQDVVVAEDLMSRMEFFFG
jgi:uncharacterized protein YoxC